MPFVVRKAVSSQELNMRGEKKNKVTKCLDYSNNYKPGIIFCEVHKRSWICCHRAFPEVCYDKQNMGVLQRWVKGRFYLSYGEHVKASGVLEASLLTKK